MARRQRRSTRERRAASGATARAATHDRPATGAPTTRRSYAGSARAGAGVRPGAARAVGAPSAALQREAEAERAYVQKDFRRIGMVVAIMAALLVLSDIAVNALLP